MTVLPISAYGANTLRRLRREARIIDPAALPALTPAYELDRSAPVPTLTAEELPDITIDDLVGLAPLPAAAVLHALHDVAATLEAMHDAGLAHGDVRPSTVLVLPDGRSAITRPAVRPAEQPTPDPATDARDFALLAFELLSGVHPLSPEDALAMASSLPTLPPAAATVLALVLTAEPERRPLPHALMVALEAVPPEDWPTNGLHRATVAPTTLVVGDTVDTPVDVRDDGPDDAPDDAPADPTDGVPPDAVTGDAVPAAEAPEEHVEEPPDPQPTEPAVSVVAAPPRRGLLRRVLAPFVVVVGLATVLAGGAAGAWLLFAPSPSAGDPPAGPPEVDRVDLSVTPPQAHCPHATMHIAATVVVDGGRGELDLRWQLPDGRPAQSESFTVDGGPQVLKAGFDLTLTGPERLRGRIVATIGGVEGSAPIRYLCPRGYRSEQPGRDRSA